MGGVGQLGWGGERGAAGVGVRGGGQGNGRGRGEGASRGNQAGE